MHKFYIDVPYDYDYVYENGERDGPEVLTHDFGVKFTFICNSYGAQRSPNKVGAVGNKGDAHMVEVESEADELLFLIKTGWTKLNNDAVELYLEAKRAAKQISKFYSKGT